MSNAIQTDFTATIRHLRWQILELDDMAACARFAQKTDYADELEQRAESLRKELATALENSKR